MPHTSRWLVDKRIVLVSYTGDIDKNELQAVNAELTNYVEEGIAPVHVISDNTNMGNIPLDVKTLQNSFGVMNNNKWGMVCVVGADTMLRFFVQIITSSFRLKKVGIVKTVEEAHQKITAYDSTLEPTI